MWDKIKFWFLCKALIASSKGVLWEARTLCKVLKLEAYGPNKTCDGICYNIDEVLWIERYAGKWYKYSGSYMYPVPHPDYDAPWKAYMEVCNMWVGEYGKNRVELLEFLRDSLIADMKPNNKLDRLVSLSLGISAKTNWKPK